MFFFVGVGVIAGVFNFHIKFQVSYVLTSSFLCSCFSVVVLTTNGGILVVFGVILDVSAVPDSCSVGS